MASPMIHPPSPPPAPANRHTRLHITNNSLLIFELCFIAVCLFCHYWCCKFNSPDRTNHFRRRDTELRNPRPTNNQDQAQAQAQVQVVTNGGGVIREFKDIDEDTDTCCSICLEGYKASDKVLCLSNCKHIFHLNCVGLWLQNDRHCPLCRGSIPSGFSPPQQLPH